MTRRSEMARASSQGPNRLLRAVLSALLISVVPSAAADGQDTEGGTDPSSPASVVAYPVAELFQGEELETEVHGAREATNAEWPATLYHMISARESCTDTLVGERVLLTAAHCIQDSGLIGFTL